MTRCWMYGPSYAVPIVSMFFACLFSWLATLGCRFLEVEYGEEVLGADLGLRTLGIGLFIIEDLKPFFRSDIGIDDEFPAGIGSSDVSLCVSWYNHSIFEASESIDTALRFARAVAVLWALVILVFFVTLSVGACVALPKSFRMGMAVTCLVFGPLFWLTLIVKKTRTCQDANNCRLGTSGIFAVLAPIAWVLAGYGVLRMKEQYPPPPVPRPVATAAEMASMDVHGEVPPGATLTEVVQEIVESNGTLTRVTIRTVTNPDGSKTVTETRQSTTTTAPAEGPLTWVEHQ